MFQGSNALTLDAKGRMSIPTRHRDALLQQDNGQLTITRHPDGCLLVYPRAVWVERREQIMRFPMSARPLQRLLLGYAQDVEMDAAGRVLVAPELRTAAGLDREVTLMGMGSHFELWDAAALARSEEAALAGGMADVLNNFSF
ncbi:division/cell wall cluster transcriptional repressor MraZ [Verticiella sediminum]|uniref:Transcriptional regulator MraZ n=1 Tax=Verticiella sediminum TaxID=1247510 RepID=A0A556A8H5_9BURK|nr:division/cell wall cluster transcriptional repressor MraZ [Verticiella sediminum]TSH89180.1 division/cell wall cluster transcriptional repressor MraZ [Verticiella sediminum]